MKKTVIIIVGAAVLIAIIVAVLYFGNFLNREPQTAVLGAVSKTLGEFGFTGESSYTSHFNNLMSGQFKQDISVKVNSLSGESFKDADPSALAALRMFAFKDSVRYDPAAKRRQDKLSVQLAVTPLAEAAIISAPNEVIASVPLLFDYAVRFDPAKYVSEWDNSVLGRSAGAVWDPAMEAAVYEAYKALLFPEPYTPAENPFNLELYRAILSTGVEYIYIGKETLADGDFQKNCDLYRVNFSGKTVSNLLNALTSDLTDIGVIPSELAVRIMTQMRGLSAVLESAAAFAVDVYVADGKVAGVTLGDADGFALYFKGEDVNLEDVHLKISGDGMLLDARAAARLRDPDALYTSGAVTLSQSGQSATELSWLFDWDNSNTSGDNLKLDASLKSAETGDISITAEGNLVAAPGRVESDLESLRLAADIGGMTSEMDIALESYIYTDTGAIDAPADIRELSAVTEMDVLEMYLKLYSDPQLGALFNQINY